MTMIMTTNGHDYRYIRSLNFTGAGFILWKRLKK